MKNPLKSNPPIHDRDNPVVPNVMEQPAERAGEQSATFDHPLVPNAIERPVERTLTEDRHPVVDRPGGSQLARNQPSPKARTATTGTSVGDEHMDLFPNEDLVEYRTQWESIQAGFVDQPRAAVEQADALVSEVVTRLTDVFSRERSTLEGQWAKGDDVSTEDLRIALTRYRAFFHRLLSM
jgi:hypothetical protein